MLKVSEYFLFDPRREYLKAHLQGYRLQGAAYLPIDPVDGRLPSEQIGLHLEPQGIDLKFWDPTTETYLLTKDEKLDEKTQQLDETMQQLERERAERAREQEENRRLREQVRLYQQQLGKPLE